MLEIGDEAERDPAEGQAEPVPARQIDLIDHLPAAPVDGVERRARLVGKALRVVGVAVDLPDDAGGGEPVGACVVADGVVGLADPSGVPVVGRCDGPTAGEL
jgi:hypothetical protein